MDTLEAQIGANLRALRGKMPMQALGDALGEYLGKKWSRQAVWDAENGRRSFTAAELLALAKVLEVTVPQLYEPPGDETLSWPSGKHLEAEDLLALTANSNSDRERWEAVLAAARGLMRFQGELNRFSTVHVVQIRRLMAAARGQAPKTLGARFDPDTTLGSIANFMEMDAERIADEWSRGPRGAKFPPIETGKEPKE